MVLRSFVHVCMFIFKCACVFSTIVCLLIQPIPSPNPLRAPQGSCVCVCSQCAHPVRNIQWLYSSPLCLTPCGPPIISVSAKAILSVWQNEQDFKMTSKEKKTVGYSFFHSVMEQYKQDISNVAWNLPSSALWSINILVKSPD